MSPLKLLLAAMLPCLFLINAGQAVGAPPETGGNPGATECVVVLHGLARTSRSMNKMSEALIRAGFRVVNLDYPSREKSVEAIALGPVDYEVGVITGTRHALFDAWFAALIPAANDGKVSVAEARVAGMADFLVVPETHPFIMNSDRVIQETVYFLRHGTFRAR